MSIYACFVILKKRTIHSRSMICSSYDGARHPVKMMNACAKPLKRAKMLEAPFGKVRIGRASGLIICRLVDA